MSCEHDLAERETACADGMCPMCLAARLAEAEKDAALDREIAQRNRDAVHELTARLAEEERDAKRYRWLRTNREEGFWKCHEKDLEGGQVLKYGTDLDATIDAARATDSATQRETAP